MESERNTRLIALVALVAAVGGLALGYSAYARDLLIKPSADVTLSDDVFSVVFSSSADSVDTASGVTASGSDEFATGEKATIVNNGDKPTISNLVAHFTKPGQTVTYEFYAVNDGAIDAYLTNIAFSNIASKEVKKECTPKDGENPAPNDTTLSDVCDKINLKVTVANDQTATSPTDLEVKTEKMISKHTTTYSSHPVKVEIEYPATAGAPAGDFEIAFGDVTLSYSATKPAGGA